QQCGTNLVKGRKRALLPDERDHVDEAIAEGAKEGEGELAISEGVVEGGGVIGHGPQAAGELRDREIPLRELPERGFEMQGTTLLVAEELVLKEEPRHTSRVERHDVLHETGGNGAIEPGEHRGLHRGPSWMVRTAIVGEDV